MANRAEIIRDATLKGRSDFQAYVVLQKKQLYDTYQRYADQLARELARSQYQGKIPPGAQVRLNKLVKKSIPPFRKSIASSIRRGASRSVDQAFVTQILALDAGGLAQKMIQLGSSFIGKGGKVIRWNAAQETFLKSTWSRMNKTAVDAVMAWKPGGIAFSDRVWDLTYQSQKQMLGIIQRGVTDGKSAATLSRELQGFLVQPERLRGKALKALKPGAGVYKSAYANARRLAATELNRAFVEGTYRYAQQKTWLDGYIWRAGSANPCPICASEVGLFFPKDEPPDIPAHPHCVRGDVKLSAVSDVQAASCRRYRGLMLTIHYLSGRSLACTPNHPILAASKGWCPAYQLRPGDSVICSASPQEGTPAESWWADSIKCRLELIMQTPDMFHGDGTSGEGAAMVKRRWDVDVLDPLLTYPDRIVCIEDEEWEGDVYNLETDAGWYFANGTVAKNCRCYPELHIAGDPME